MSATKTDVVRLHQETLDALEQALKAPADQLKSETAKALRAAVRLRDSLIERLRGAHAAEDQVAPRAALDQVNVALSLITGVEYPIEKMDRSALRQAKGVLEGLVSAGWL